MSDQLKIDWYTEAQNAARGERINEVMEAMRQYGVAKDNPITIMHYSNNDLVAELRRRGINIKIED